MSSGQERKISKEQIITSLQKDTQVKYSQTLGESGD